MIEPEIHPRFIDWLAARRTAPGVLDGGVLRAFATRFQRRSVRNGLLERLLRRLAMFSELSGETLVWRMPWEGDNAAMDSLPVARSSVVAAHGVMLARESPVKFESVPEQRGSAARARSMAPAGAVARGSTASVGRVMPSTLALEHDASMPMRPLRRAPSAPLHSTAASTETRSQLSAASRDGVAVSNAKEFASTRVTVERASGDAAKFGARLHARYGGSPAEPIVLASRPELALPASARASEDIVLLEPAIPSGQRGPNQMPARKVEPAVPAARSMEVTSRDSVFTGAPSVRPALHDARAEETLVFAKETPLGASSDARLSDDPTRPFVADPRAAAAREHRPDSPARAPLLLRRGVAAKSPEPARITDSSHELPPLLGSDSKPTARSHPLEPQRAAIPLTAPHPMDSLQFDALVERLVARLEREARRQGRYRWRN